MEWKRRKSGRPYEEEDRATCWKYVSGGATMRGEGKEGKEER